MGGFIGLIAVIRIGLTGGIGSGKTTVARLFGTLGVPVLDADQIARDLVHPQEPAWHAIVAHFGKDIVKSDQQIDRHHLRYIIFHDPKSKEWLESLLHPKIYEVMEQKSRFYYAPYILLVIPLLLENRRQDVVNRVLLVDCSVSQQQQRVKDRDGLDDTTIHSILSAQWSRESRLQAADDIIHNLGSQDALVEQVYYWHRFYLSLV